MPPVLSFGIKRPFQIGVELAESVIFTDKGPVVGQLVFNRVSLFSLTGHVFTGSNGQSIRSAAARTELREQTSPEKHSHSRGFLLVCERDLAPGKFAGRHHEHDLL